MAASPAEVVDDRSAIPALVDFLSWESGNRQVLSDACTRHVRWCFHRAYFWGTQLGENSLFDEVRSLPPANQQRLLLAPLVSYLLGCAPDAAGLVRLRRFMEMERFLAEQRDAASGWSALGDVYRPEGNAGSAASEETWLPDREFRARRVGHLVLDTHCEHNSFQIPDAAAGAVSHPAEELDSIQSNITQALDRIRERSAEVASMIRECARLIRVDRLSSHQEFCMSYSQPNIIGRIGLINAHNAARCTVTKIMNDLVHESVHSMIYKIELVTPLYVDYPAASVLTAVSPWSNRVLKLHSFVHACFVWYALWAFWSRFEEDDPQVRGHEQRAKSGFPKGDPVDLLSPEARANVLPDVLEAMSILARRVR